MFTQVIVKSLIALNSIERTLDLILVKFFAVFLLNVCHKN